jgi:sialidase-1
VWVATSEDDGVTWSTPREITAEVKLAEWTWYATGPGVGIQLKRGEHKGRLVVPCNHASGVATNAKGDWNVSNSHVIFSDDYGKTWRRGGGPSVEEFNESQVVELADGGVMLNMRNSFPKGVKNPVKARGVAISKDGGETFMEARRDEALIEPVFLGSIVRYTWPSEGREEPDSVFESGVDERACSDDGSDELRRGGDVAGGETGFQGLVVLFVADGVAGGRGWFAVRGGGSGAIRAD